MDWYSEHIKWKCSYGNPDPLEQSKLDLAERMEQLNIPSAEGGVLWQALCSGRVLFIDRRGDTERVGLILPDEDGKIRI